MKQLYKDATFIALAVLAGIGFLALAQCLNYQPSYLKMLFAVVLMGDTLNDFAKYLTTNDSDVSTTTVQHH